MVISGGLVGGGGLKTPELQILNTIHFPINYPFCGAALELTPSCFDKIGG